MVYMVELADSEREALDMECLLDATIHSSRPHHRRLRRRVVESTRHGAEAVA